MAVDLGNSTARSWVMPGRRRLVLRQPAEIMGIINATPDSFSDGGAHLEVGAAVAAGERMSAAGAAWLDVGGESSRPGAAMIAAEVEAQRVLPVITGLRARLPGIGISVDTVKASVARAALAAGADLVNDISAGNDPEMFDVVASARCPIVLMHMQGTPRTMQRAPAYGDVVDEVEAFLAERMQAAVAAGVPQTMIVLDPGIGFGKTVEHNLRLLGALPRLGERLGRPLLVGISRKSFLSTVTGLGSAAPGDRDGASHVLHGLLSRHCALLRAHDVPGALAACRLASAVRSAAEADEDPARGGGADV